MCSSPTPTKTRRSKRNWSGHWPPRSTESCCAARVWPMARSSELAREVPLVVVNRVVADLPAVVMDVANGARQAIDHLVDLGHHELLYLGGPRTSWTNREIRRAAAATARARGVNLVALGPIAPTEAGGAAAAGDVRRSGATAVLAYNDLMAIGLLRALTSLGLDVPGEISVVGIDDIPPVQSGQPDHRGHADRSGRPHRRGHAPAARHPGPHRTRFGPDRARSESPHQRADDPSHKIDHSPIDRPRTAAHARADARRAPAGQASCP